MADGIIMFIKRVQLLIYELLQYNSQQVSRVCLLMAQIGGVMARDAYKVKVKRKREGGP